MPVMSLGRTFGWWADRDPDGPAVRDDDRTITRAQLDRESNRLARAYQQRGVGVDDVVTIGLPNGVEFVVVCAAVWKAGAVPQPVPQDLPPDELSAIIELADPALLVGFDSGFDAGRPRVLAGYVPDSGLPDHELPDVHASSWKAPVSSGSTGRPKIIFSGTPATVDPTAPTASYIPASATQLVCAPLDHSAPFLFAMRGLFVGHTLVVQRGFEPEAVLAAIEQHGVTWALLVPTMMHRIWRLDEAVRTRYDLSSLDSILHVGARCPQRLKRAWLDWLGPDRVWEIYAGTESAGVTVIGGREWLDHPGSVGRPAPGFTFCVLDESGEPVPAGTVGEVFMRPRGGPGSTYRYVGGDARQVGDWESIGDLGRLDAEGYLYLVDRSADVIVTASGDVYPADLEAVLDEHPAVRSSAVIGLPDGSQGERVHAIVDIDDVRIDGSEFATWLRDHGVPDAVEIEIVRSVLRDDAGKVRRSALRAERLRG